MNDNELVGLSKKYKNQANLLLKNSDTLKILENYGKIRMTGSYSLDLMLSGDIDIHIINPSINKAAVLRAFGELVNQNYFNGYHFYNWVKFKKEEFPRGYYIGLSKKINYEKWKIDIWFVKRDNPKEIELMKKVEKNLNNENKLRILRFKYLRREKSLDVGGVKIYKAVIEENIKSIREFLRKFK